METSTAHRRFRSVLVIVLLSLALPTLPAAREQKPAQAGEPSMTFTETGKTVRGRFLEYWARNGGTVAQGLPISEEMQERNDADGKTYKVQYFERAIFEYHPQNAKPYDVLLSLLGVSRYKQKYPQGTPGQHLNGSRGERFFPETGKGISCEFTEFWERYGGLAQFGYPISDVFIERSEVDGKQYSVQYFQRAVLEYHPEEVYQAATRSYSNVVAAPVGTLRYAAEYSATLLPSSVADQVVGATRCTPTEPTDYYGRPPAEAPVRSSVGKGHVLKGTVRSSKDCAPIAGAKLVFGVTSGRYREYLGATVFANNAGEYTFESDMLNMPEGLRATLLSGSSAGRSIGSGAPLGKFGLASPPAKPGENGIMIYSSSEGYKPVGTSILVACDATETVLDLVLAPIQR